MDIFNRLPDRYASTDYGLVYQGKDLNTLPVFYEYSGITDQKDRRLAVEIVQHLDHKALVKEGRRFKALVRKSNQQ